MLNYHLLNSFYQYITKQFTCVCIFSPPPWKKKLTNEKLVCKSWLSTISPCIHFRKCIENNVENIHNDVKVYRDIKNTLQILNDTNVLCSSGVEYLTSSQKIRHEIRSWKKKIIIFCMTKLCHKIFLIIPQQITAVLVLGA